MKYRVVLAPQADRDVTEIVDWIAVRSSAGADEWLSALHAALDRLEFNPLGYPSAAESDYVLLDVREFSFKTRRGRTYRGVFRVVERTVNVLHIRGPGEQLLRPEDFVE